MGTRNVKGLKTEKAKFFLTLLQDGVASLHFDPRAQGVVVPPRFSRQSSLVLNYSFNYHIADFDIDDQGVVATLTFAGQPCCCTVPWRAVYAMRSEVTGEMRAWPDALPVELQQEMFSPPRRPSQARRAAVTSALPPTAAAIAQLSAAKKGGAESAAAKTAPRRPTLQLLSGGAAATEPDPAEPDLAADAAVAPAPRAGHLRRIK